jgi:hypothetical protein
LRTAVEVQSLAKGQVEDYLASVGEPLLGLRTAVEDDASMWELLETPLMLWVAMLAYRDAPSTPLEGLTAEQRQRHLFAHFTEAMFQRKPIQWRYTSEQIKRWLSSVARVLAKNNQTIFYLEDLDFNWLPSRPKRWLAQAGMPVTMVLSSELLLMGPCVWAGNDAMGLLVVWPLVALPFAVLSSIIRLKPVEKVRFSLTDLSLRVRAALPVGLLFGLIIGLLAGRDGGWVVGLRMGWEYGLCALLIRLFTSESSTDTRSTPNQGTRRSLRVAAVVGLSYFLFIGLSSLSIAPVERRYTLLGGLMLMLLFGIILGGAFSIKHFVLRLFLWLSRSAPLNYVAFLAQAKDLLFLRQVGGGYIFTHRLLREYFASLANAEAASEPRN